MKAAVQHEYGPPDDVFAVEAVDPPEVGAGEVLVRVVAAGVNWADQSMTIGKPYVMRLGYGFGRPRNGIRGTDVAGVVEAVGPDVTRFQRGDEVFGVGAHTFAELAVAKADHLASKPGNTSFEQAAGLPMAGCVAIQALRDIAETKPGDRVLVNGASGGIGSLAVQIAKSFGAEVTGVCSRPNVEFVESLGVDTAIDYTLDDFTQAGERYDLILDMADNRSLRARRRVLTDSGTLIPNSGKGGPVFGSLGRIVKARLASPFVRQRFRPFLSLAKQADLEAVARLVSDGELDPIVGRTYSLGDTGAAIALAGSGHARGKVVVVP